MVSILLAAGCYGMAVKVVSAAPAPDRPGSTEAEVEWKRLTAELAGKGAGRKEDPVGYEKEQEQRRRRYRDLGLTFYNKFPNDARRWDWLLNTMKTVYLAPHYWKDLDQGARLTSAGRSHEAEIDTAARDLWEELVRTRLRPQFMASPQVTSEQRAKWYYLEMESIQTQSATLLSRGEKESLSTEVRVDSFVDALMRYAAEPAVAAAGSRESISWAVGVLNVFLRLAERDAAVQSRVVRILQSSPNEILRGYAAGIFRVLELREKPLALQLTTTDQNALDVADWRGKVVLVDFWSTSCRGCIEEMPKIGKVYERYHEKGFEVVSICLDIEKNKSKIEAIAKRIGVAWPMVFEPWETTPLIARFGITGVPVYFLLDKNGLLTTTEIGDGNLEREVRRLLEAQVRGLPGR